MLSNGLEKVLVSIPLTWIPAGLPESAGGYWSIMNNALYLKTNQTKRLHCVLLLLSIVFKEVTLT